MFILKDKIVGGYRFKERTFYGTKHLGTDYRAKSGTECYAPFDGVITYEGYGVQGGNTIWFKPNGRDVIIRLMHLSKFKASGKVKKGQVIALTGNTGLLTKAPHLHIDISKGTVKLNDINNFLDPEKYPW